MRIYTRSGDLSFSTFTFPDGQPHFKLNTYERDFQVATVEMAIKSPSDLFTLSLATDVLRQHGYSEVNLDIRYLMGARMDRSIDSLQPDTLRVVARQINAMGFNQVRILDVHSEVAARLIRNSSNVLPLKIVQQVVTTLGGVVVVIPDKGAITRVDSLVGGWMPRIYGSKERDPQTGAITNFKVDVPHPFNEYTGFSALIIDDICDGGGTFVGLAKELRKAGATKVSLFVTHGIFSKGLPLEGIDRVFTTDSFIDKSYFATVLPISMKEMK